MAAEASTGTVVAAPAWQRAPWLGWLAFGAIWLYKPLAHTILVLLHGAFQTNVQYLVGALIGLAGFALVWRGFDRDELTATWLGFFGGALIWMGWFEYSFEFFARVLGVQPVLLDGRPVLTPNLVLIEASGVALLAMLVFLGANKDTGCRMFLWFHRNAGLRPGSSTPGYQRQFSRIAAMEFVFTNWFCYVLMVTLFDPRILGPRHPVTFAVFALFAALSVWFVAVKLPQQRLMAPAIRYSIGAVAVAWTCFEMASAWRWYVEFWTKPAQFPVANAAILALFVAAVLAANATRKRGAPPVAA